MTSNETLEVNKATVRRLYEEYYNQGNLDLLPILAAPNIENHSNKIRGHSEFLANTKALHTAFEGLQFNIDDMFAGGDLVVSVWKMTGRNVAPFLGIEPTGEMIENQGLVVMRMVDGRISEVWGQVARARQNAPSAAT